MKREIKNSKTLNFMLSTAAAAFAMLMPGGPLPAVVHAADIVINPCASISSFTLVDAKTRQDIGDLPAFIDTNKYPVATTTGINIRVNVDDKTGGCERPVQSVLIKYKSTANKNTSRTVCEEALPYTVFGDNNPKMVNITDLSKVKYVAYTFPNVSTNSNVRASLFFEPGCKGKERGVSRSQNFRVALTPAKKTCEDWGYGGLTISAGQWGESLGSAVDLSSDATTLAIGSACTYCGPYYPGHASVWKAGDNEWTQQGDLIPGEHNNDQPTTGNAMALSMDGTALVVGARFNDDAGTDAGHARVFRFNQEEGVWMQLGQDLDGTQAGELFGYSVAISQNGEVVAVGAPLHAKRNGTKAGLVQVWVWNTAKKEWSRRSKDLLGANGGDYFGSSVALSADGSILAVGSAHSDINGDGSGMVKVWKWDTMTTSWQAYGQEIVGAGVASSFGWSISLSADGQKLVVGSPGNTAHDLAIVGKVRVYSFDTSSNTKQWVQIGQDLDGGMGDGQGYAVDISADGNSVIIGAPYRSGVSVSGGRVSVWRWDTKGKVWVQVGKTFTPRESRVDKLGSAVAISGDGSVIAVGAPGARLRGDSGGGRVTVYKAFKYTCYNYGL